jgi:ribonucleoside-diphosphate reductase alpha chain
MERKNQGEERKVSRVKKRNGRLETFNVDKINTCAERACFGLENVSPSELVLDAELTLYDKITTQEIDDALTLAARAKIYKDPNWSIVASRLLLSNLYKEVLKESVEADTFDSDYRSAFIRNIKKYVKRGILDERLLDFDLKKMADHLEPDRDNIFTYVGIKNLYDRYFLRDPDTKVVFETPQAAYMRIAMGLCVLEGDDRNERALELYNVYSKHLASPSTPTLFNSGTKYHQLSSCYLTEIGDSVDAIFDGLWQEARKSKYAGGLGFHFSKVRGMGSHIKGTNGKSSGIVPWLKVYNDMLIACDQAGKRRGSGCAYIEPWHIDVEEFIELRKETGEERRRTHDLNTALWCSDLFFKRIEADGDWYLFCPSETPDLPDLFGKEFEQRYEFYITQADAGLLKNFKVLKAKDLWKSVIKSLFETSHPWITFKDVSNERYSDQHLGPLHGSNLCCEILRHTIASQYVDGEKTKVGETAVCNLASIRLPSFLTKGNEIDKDLLKSTIRSVIRGLDNVIDINFYPTKEAENSNLKHRPIGMGTMGWANVFCRLGIPCDSDEAVRFADKLMELISFYAIEASADLAVEKGAYQTFEGSLWSKGILPIDTWNEKCGVSKDTNENGLDWNGLRERVKSGFRNGSVMAIAPNASIAYQLNCEQSIEPLFRVLFRYENLSGDYFVINTDFVDALKAKGLWTTEMAESVRSSNGDPELLDLPEDIKRVYCSVFERDMFKLIDVNAARQKWVDQGISFNMYFGGPKSLTAKGAPSLKYLNDIYLHAWKQGLKTTYYLRIPAASKVTHLDQKEKKVEVIEEKTLACSIEAMKSGGSCEMCEG